MSSKILDTGKKQRMLGGTKENLLLSATHMGRKPRPKSKEQRMV